MKITRRLLTPTLIFITVVILGILSVQTWAESLRLTRDEEDSLTKLASSFNSRLQADTNLAVALAIEVANNAEVQTAFAARDRDALTALTLPSYQELTTRFDIPQYQFHLPPATSFLRLHQLDRFGDDLTGFRQTVIRANADQEVVSGLELGRGGLGLRGVAPVAYQGQHVGTVEFGSNLDLAVLQTLKENFDADWQIMIRQDIAEIAVEGFVGTTPGPVPQLLLQASTLAEPLFGPSDGYVQALGGEPAYTRRVVRGGENFGLLTIPLRDFSGQVIGVVDILIDRTALAQLQWVRGGTFIAALVLALGITGYGLARIVRRVLQPIGELTDAAEAIASGDRSRLVQVDSPDELGVLANAFNRMTDQLRTLIDTLEERVADRTRALVTSAEVSRSLSTILTEEQLVSEVVRQVGDAFNFYHVQIYLLDEETQTLRMTGGTGAAGQHLLAGGHKLAMGQGLVGQAAAEKTAVLVPDVTQSPQWLPNPLLPNTRAESAIPILLGNRLLGVLDVQHRITGGLNDENVSLLQTIASQIAIALQNARQLAEIEANNQRLDLVVRSTNDGIWDWEIANNKTYFSPRWKAILGYADDEIASNQAEFARYLYPEDQERILQAMADYLSGAVDNYEHEFRMQHKDGSYRWILARASLVQDKAGNPLRVAGSHSDITARKEAEANILATQERFSLAVAGSNDGLWDWNIPTNQVYFSPRWKEMLGYADEELIDEFAEFETKLHPDDHDPVLQTVDDFLNGRLAKFEIEFRMQHKNGSYRWILARAALVRNEAGAPMRMAGSHSDITARKEAEEAIRQEQARTQAILEAVTTPLLITRLDGSLIFANERAADMVGLSLDRLDQFNTGDFYAEPVARQEVIRLLQTQGFVSNYELLLRRFNQEAFWGLISSRIFNFQGEPAIVSSIVDITKRREAELALAARARELQTVALVGTAAATILEPDRLLQEVVDLTKKQFGLYHAHIYLLNEEGDTLLLRNGAGEIGQQLVAQKRQIPLHQEQSLVARAARSQTGVVVNDVRTEPGFLPNPLLPETRAEMAVPLVVRGQVLGVLDVQATAVGRFTQEEIDIFTILATQVAVALQNARRYDEAQRALDELTRIQRVLVREGWQAFLTTQQRPLQGFYFDQKKTHPLLTGETAVARHQPETLIPMTIRGEAIGKIGVRNPSGAPLNDNQRQLLTNLTNQVAEALERARLSEQTQIALSEAETLSQLGAKLNAAQTYQQINSAVTDIMKARTHEALTGVLFEVLTNAQREPEWLQLLISNDETGVVGQYQRFPITMLNPQPAWVVSDGAPVLIANTQTDPRLNDNERALYQQTNVTSIAFLPLRLGGHWVALFTLAWSNPYTFTETDARILTAVVDQLALALNSLKLLSVAQSRARQEQLLREVSTRVSSVVDAESVLKTAAREIGRALGLETFIYLKPPTSQAVGNPAETQRDAPQPTNDSTEESSRKDAEAQSFQSKNLRESAKSAVFSEESTNN